MHLLCTSTSHTGSEATPCSFCSLCKWKNIDMTSSDFEPFAHLILRCSMLLGAKRFKESFDSSDQQCAPFAIYNPYVVWYGILLGSIGFPWVYHITAKSRKASVAQCAKRQVGPRPEHH